MPPSPFSHEVPGEIHTKIGVNDTEGRSSTVMILSRTATHYIGIHRKMLMWDNACPSQSAADVVPCSEKPDGDVGSDSNIFFRHV